MIERLKEAVNEFVILSNPRDYDSLLHEIKGRNWQKFAETYMVR